LAVCAGILFIFPILARAEEQLSPELDPIGQSARAAFADPKTSEERLISEYRSLGFLPAESPSFWRELIKDKRFTERRRKLFMFMLLQRHVRSRMNLLELAHLMPKNDFYSIEDLKLAGAYAGGAQPEFWSENVTVAIRMAPGEKDKAGPLIYFVLDQKHADLEALLSALHGDPSPTLKDALLLDICPRGLGD
jgi:hypothetical protein